MMLDLAGELADGTVTTWAGMNALERHIIPRITKAAAGAGRAAPQVIASLPVAVTAHPDELRTEIAQRYAMAEQSPPYQAILDKGGLAGVAEAAIVGDEAEVLAEVKRFADIGVTEFVPVPFADPETRSRTTQLLCSMTA